MGNDVVQLPGDPRPLLGDGALRTFLTFPLGPLRPLLELLEATPPLEHLAAQHQRKRRRQECGSDLCSSDRIQRQRLRPL